MRWWVSVDGPFGLMHVEARLISLELKNIAHILSVLFKTASELSTYLFLRLLRKCKLPLV